MNALLRHFREMFHYDRWANRRVCRAVAGLQPDREGAERAIELYSHVLRASDVWFARTHGDTGPIERLWEPFEAGRLEAETERTGEEWRAFLDELPHDELGRTVGYRTSTGVEHRDALEAILRHVLNHGTHHRGQVVLTLRGLGLDPPVTDYIAMVREDGGPDGRRTRGRSSV